MSPSIGYNKSQHDALADACKLAWHTFYSMQKVSEDFENLRFEVWTVAISLDSLHSVGSTSLLIDRQPDNRRWALTFSKILNSLNAALRPLYNLVKLYLSASTKDRAAVRQWLTNQDVYYDGVTIQDFRRKLSMLVESLNVFLSSLTHAELARARAAPETEEFRVLSEVTRTFLQKWDHGTGDSTGQQITEGTRIPNSPGLQTNDTLTEHSISPLSSVFLSSDAEGPGLPSSPSHRPSLNNPTENLNLDGIETGFRRHVHAMRRIRQQLPQQREDGDHFYTLGTTRFRQPVRSPILPDSAPLPGRSSENTDCSNSGISSTDSSQITALTSTFNDGISRSPSIPANVAHSHARTLSGESARKRGRSQHDEIQPGRVNEYMGSCVRNGKPHKTVLEQTLSAALFFDSC
jgi:hypothetical protein